MLTSQSYDSMECQSRNERAVEEAGPSRLLTPTRPKSPLSPSPTSTLEAEPTKTSVQLSKQISIQDQSSRLSFKRILLIYFGIGIALVVSFIDQTSVSTAAPVIGTELGGSDSISWVGTAFFVAK